jgi:hypothetical protein
MGIGSPDIELKSIDERPSSESPAANDYRSCVRGVPMPFADNTLPKVDQKISRQSLYMDELFLGRVWIERTFPHIAQR